MPGLLTNSTSQIQVELEAVAGGEAAVQAVTLVPGVEGGRRIKAQVYLTPEVSPTIAYAQGTQIAGIFTDGTIPAGYFSDGTVPAPFFTRGAAIGTLAGTTERFDLTVTIKDIAFEQLDLFGGNMSPQERSREANKF